MLDAVVESSLLAASIWPLGVFLAVPVALALFLSAFRFAKNSGQRLVNMVVGLLGAVASLIVLIVYLERTPNPWIEDRIPLLASSVMTFGAALGVVLSVLIRKVRK